MKRRPTSIADFKDTESAEDTFHDVVRWLEEEKPFQLSRWGDGEFQCARGERGMNCDGHQYFPGLGHRLRSILDSDPKYVMAIGALAIESYSYAAFSRGIDWRNAGCFTWAYINGYTGHFLDLLKARGEKDGGLFIGPEHLSTVAEKILDFEHLEIPTRDCWETTGSTSFVRSVVERGKKVIGITGGMAACDLVDSLSKKIPDATVIDIGSCLDPMGGHFTRSYHYTRGLQ